MFPADACNSVYYEERAAEWEAARQAQKKAEQKEAAKAKEQSDRLNQVSARLQQLQRPGMPSRAASTGYFGALFQNFQHQQKQAASPRSTLSRSASASPPPAEERKLKPSEMPMPKATWAGPSEGEVCVVPAWS